MMFSAESLWERVITDMCGEERNRGVGLVSLAGINTKHRDVIFENNYQQCCYGMLVHLFCLFKRLKVIFRLLNFNPFFCLKETHREDTN